MRVRVVCRFLDRGAERRDGLRLLLDERAAHRVEGEIRGQQRDTIAGLVRLDLAGERLDRNGAVDLAGFQHVAELRHADLDVCACATVTEAASAATASMN